MGSKIKREQKIEATRKHMRAKSNLAESFKKIDSSKETVQKRKVAARKAETAQHDKMKHLREKSRKVTMKSLRKAALAVQKRAEQIKANYQKEEKLRLLEVARADAKIRASRDKALKAKNDHAAAVAVYKAAVRAQKDFAKTQAEVTSQVAKARKSGNKDQIDAATNLQGAIQERAQELTEKSKLAQRSERAASDEASDAQRARTAAVKSMEDAHAEAVEAAKLAQAAVKRCNSAKERSSKSKLKMKDSVWTKLEKAATNPK